MVPRTNIALASGSEQHTEEHNIQLSTLRHRLLASQSIGTTVEPSRDTPRLATPIRTSPPRSPLADSSFQLHFWWRNCSGRFTPHHLRPHIHAAEPICAVNRALRDAQLVLDRAQQLPSPTASDFLLHLHKRMLPFNEADDLSTQRRRSACVRAGFRFTTCDAIRTRRRSSVSAARLRSRRAFSLRPRRSPSAAISTQREWRRASEEISDDASRRGSR